MPTVGAGQYRGATALRGQARRPSRGHRSALRRSDDRVCLSRCTGMVTVRTPWAAAVQGGLAIVCWR
jgi:hypothetical protein